MKILHICSAKNIVTEGFTFYIYKDLHFIYSYGKLAIFYDANCFAPHFIDVFIDYNREILHNIYQLIIKLKDFED